MSKNDPPYDFPREVTTTNPRGDIVTTREYFGENGKRVIEIEISRSLSGGGR